MMFLKLSTPVFATLLIVSFGSIGCGPTRFKISDRALTQKMRDATLDHTGHINAKGKLYDGYDIAIVGDSLEWYEAPNQSGTRHTSDVHDVDAVSIKHAHSGWPLAFGFGGFAVGALFGSYAELAASDVGNRPFSVTTPLICGLVGVPIGYFGAILFDPGVQENAWILKTITPRGEK